MSNNHRSPPTTDDHPPSSVGAQPPVGTSSFLLEDELASPATPAGGGAGFEASPDAQTDSQLARLLDAIEQLTASVEEQGRRLNTLIAAVEQLSASENNDPSAVPFLSDELPCRGSCVDPIATDTSATAFPSPGLPLS